MTARVDQFCGRVSHPARGACTRRQAEDGDSCRGCNLFYKLVAYSNARARNWSLKDGESSCLITFPKSLRTQLPISNQGGNSQPPTVLNQLVCTPQTLNAGVFTTQLSLFPLIPSPLPPDNSNSLLNEKTPTVRHQRNESRMKFPQKMYIYIS